MATNKELMDMVGALGALVNNLCELGIIKETGTIRLPQENKSWVIGELLDEVNVLLEDA